MSWPFSDAFRRQVAGRCAAFSRVAEPDGSAGLKRAAVAITLLPLLEAGGPPRQAAFLLTRRAEGLRGHGGQWALPGGRCEAHESSAEAADEVSKFFVAPLLDFHRRLLAEGNKAGEFRKIDPVLFYTSLIGACDHLFFGRHAMTRVAGVGPVTEQVCRDYIRHMEAMVCNGMLKPVSSK